MRLRRHLEVVAVSTFLALAAGCTNVMMIARYPIMVRVVDAAEHGMAGVKAEVTRVECPGGHVATAYATKGTSTQNGNLGLVVMTKVCYGYLGRLRLSPEQVIQRAEIQFESADGRKSTRWFDGPFHHVDCGDAGTAQIETTKEVGETPMASSAQLETLPARQ